MKLSVMFLAVLVGLSVGCGEVTTADEPTVDGAAGADAHVMARGERAEAGAAGGEAGGRREGAAGGEAGADGGAGGAPGRPLGAGCTSDDQCSSQTCVVATTGMCCDGRPLDACSSCVGGYLTALKDGSSCGPGEGPPYSCQSGRCLLTP